MNIFKQLFCKHEYKFKHNLFLALNDDWPCAAYPLEIEE